MSAHPTWLVTFVKESNRIEGILRAPTTDELDAHQTFLRSPALLNDVAALVRVCAPGHRLRTAPGLNVRVGDYIAPEGGPAIQDRLEALLEDLPNSTPRANHVAYETLHPFTDGNGRSGRALWLWQHLRVKSKASTPERAKALGFLHTYYYETLAESRAHQGEGQEEETGT